eukprot:5882239-Pyramimonas_sp.AAC.1
MVSVGDVWLGASKKEASSCRTVPSGGNVSSRRFIDGGTACAAIAETRHCQYRCRLGALIIRPPVVGVEADNKGPGQ